MMSRTYAFLATVLLNLLISLVNCRYVLREFNDDIFINSLVPGNYRPYGGKRFLSILEPRRVIRQDYTPTPCRWKLCASFYRR